MEIVTFVLTFALRAGLKGFAVWIILSCLVGMKLIAGTIAFSLCVSIGAGLTLLEVNGSFTEKPLLD
jgi:hypothetical protein